MCTAVTYKTKEHYFGRNLDLEYSFDETVTVTPRNYAFCFRQMGTMEMHYAMIGVAYVSRGYPLYYDATNEKGLSIAGLHFPGNAVYNPCVAGKDNVASFELIPWILGQCADVLQAQELLLRLNVWDESFSSELPASPLHWLIADRERSITVEAVKGGVKLYENAAGVLTNDPTFDFHLLNLNHYMRLTSAEPDNTFAEGLALKAYSRGMGAIGLPGDASSASRFVRAAFTKLNSVSEVSEAESVSQFLHILRSVEMPRGCVRVAQGAYAVTVYSSCCNTDRGIYYYTTYGNSRINAVDMHRENTSGSRLISYPLKVKQDIAYQNG